VNLNFLQEGRTPLHSACEVGHVEVASVLLAAGAALEAREKVSVVWDLDEMS
jgi:ankyrin repeat protein